MVEAPIVEPNDPLIELGLSEIPSFTLNLPDGTTPRVFVKPFPEKDRSIVIAQAPFDAWHIYTIVGSFDILDEVDRFNLEGIVRMHEKKPYWGVNLQKSKIKGEIQERSKYIENLEPTDALKKRWG